MKIVIAHVGSGGIAQVTAEEKGGIHEFFDIFARGDR